MLRYYLKIYKAILKINIHLLLAHRANFINNLASSLGWGVFSIVTILILTSKAPQITNWSRNEIILLAGAYSITVGIMHTFFSKNFELIPELVELGRFDLVLVKPPDSQFLASFQRFNFTSIFRIVIGIFVIVYIVLIEQIKISFINLFGFSILILVGVAVIYSIWLLCITLTFWINRSDNLSEFLFSINSLSRLPGEVYRETLSYLYFFLLPLLLTVTVPTKTLLGKALAGDVILLVLSAVCLVFISRKFWLFALKYYQSSG